MSINVRVWDWPLRLFHWLLVLAVVGCYTTGKLGGSLTDWHQRLGGLVLGLLIFRLIWGFVGTEHARFVSFFPTFSRLIAYIKGEWQGIGHNPAGAVAVICLLLALSFLVGTGLFANDDIASEGPLYSLIDKDLSNKLSGWHSRAVYALIALLGLHLTALLYYRFVKKTNLVGAMLTGKKQLPKTLAPSSIGSVSSVKIVLSLMVSISVVWVIWSGGFTQYIAPLASNLISATTAKS